MYQIVTIRKKYIIYNGHVSYKLHQLISSEAAVCKVHELLENLYWKVLLMASDLTPSQPHILPVGINGYFIYTGLRIRSTHGNFFLIRGDQIRVSNVCNAGLFMSSKTPLRNYKDLLVTSRYSVRGVEAAGTISAINPNILFE